MTSQHRAVSNLNIGTLISNAERRGYTDRAWYLISVEAGFEIWPGGTGLATNSFSVRLTATPRNWPPPGDGSAPPPVSQPYQRTSR